MLKNSDFLNKYKSTKKGKFKELIEVLETERIERRKNEFKNTKILSEVMSLNHKKLGTAELENNFNIDQLKIIGITGSFGKTSTALLVHRYLQSIGKKSVLYCSAYVDSPATWVDRADSFNKIIESKEDLANILQECIDYKAEYLVLECWEASIARGIFDDIKFSLKILTSFKNNFMEAAYKDKDTYFNNKLKFFTSDPDCPILMNLRSDESESFRYQDFIKKTKNKKYYFNIQKELTPKLKKLNITVDYSLEWDAINKEPVILNFIDKSIFSIKSANYPIQRYNTPLTGWNIDNVLCTFAILDIIRALDIDAFKEFIENPELYIAGRNQCITWKDRKIIIDYDMINALEVAADAKEMSKTVEALSESEKERLGITNVFKINKIRSIITPRSIRISTNKYRETYEQKYLASDSNRILDDFNIEYALTDNDAALYNKFADQVILNPVNIGNGDYKTITDFMASKLTVPTVSYQDRFKAILNTLIDSEPGDVIIIGGRANRKLNTIGYDKVVIGSDFDFVNKAIKALDNIM